jgi:hypothetical protein
VPSADFSCMLCAEKLIVVHNMELGLRKETLSL